ncbi:MAG TPA: DNA polymerase III subunit gamma/tau [Thiomicrospira sp.]|nr:DNA polymerase III subunit gamma/tau [Thiomicrospira sp.]
MLYEVCCMSYVVLARKWRPKKFSELVGQQHVMQALANALDQQRLHHAYLFTGTRGVGKTTIARIFSKALNCEQGISSTPCGTCSTCQTIDEGRFVDLIEVDAASKTKVEDTRELLENVQYAPVQGRFKVYLIDEVHMLSKSSFNALLKTLEEPPEHVKFLLATTDPHKLPITVLSRCLQFNLMRLTQQQINQHLAFILEQEQLPFDKTSLALIAKSANGSARDALSILDQAISYGGGEVRFDEVQTMLGLVDQQHAVHILQALLAGSAEKIKQVIIDLSAIGVNYEALVDQLIEVFHQISMLQILGSLTEEVMPIDEAVLNEAATGFDANQIQALYQIALLSKQDMQLAPDNKIGFEMALLRMLAFNFSTEKKASEATIPKPIPRTTEPNNQQLQPIQEPMPTDYNYNQLIEPKQPNTNVPVENTDEKHLDKVRGIIKTTLGKPIIANEKMAESLTEKKVEPLINKVQQQNEQNNGFTVEELINLPWAEIILKLNLKGMEAELANHAVLVELNTKQCILSIDPNNLQAQTEMAVAKLAQILLKELGVQLQFIDKPIAKPINNHDVVTPAKQAEQKQQQQSDFARKNIYNDPQVKNFMKIINMKVIDSSIKLV